MTRTEKMVHARETVEHINALLELGWSSYAISLEAGTSPTTCRTIVNRYEASPDAKVRAHIARAFLAIPLSSKRNSAEHFDERMRVLQQAGFTVQEIATITGISRGCIRRDNAPETPHKRSMEALNRAWPEFERRAEARVRLLKEMRGTNGTNRGNNIEETK